MNTIIRLMAMRTLLVFAISCASPTTHVGATRRSAFPAQLVGRALTVAGAEDAGPIEIYVERWSTDEELQKLVGTFAEGGPGELLTALEREPHRAGVLLLPGVQGHGERVRTRTPKNLQFAREIITPEGRRVILASDERLGLGESRLEARKEIQEFTLMDIRFGPDGTGVGKVAAERDVVFNPETKLLELRDYDAKPVRLVNLKSAKP
jgi:hypothetical protein